jgi:hypothetical protein
MDQGAFLECEQGLTVVAVAVLLDGVADGLAGEGVLQGQSGYSYPIPKTGIGSSPRFAAARAPRERGSGAFLVMLHAANSQGSN